MTREDDFWSLLEKTPDDNLTRLVFADWLQESGDPRADGMRVLGLTNRRALPFDWDQPDPTEGYLIGNMAAIKVCMDRADEWKDYNGRFAVIEADWFSLCNGPDLWNGPNGNIWRHYRGFREAEEDIISAFARLPATRRASLLEKAQSGHYQKLTE